MAASILFWRGEQKWTLVSCAVAGAWIPDLPMFVFYAVEKFRGFDEQIIFDELYFQPQWQLLFDGFNSIPIALMVALFLGHWCRQPWIFVMAASAMLHMICDLPLHHDDAHRHFLPFSNYRLESPVSYWDPMHFGLIVMPLELIFLVGSSLFVLKKSQSRPARTFAGITLAMFGLAVGLGLVAFAVRWWGG